MKSTIFRLYDIRGVYDEEFTAPDAYRIGKCFAEHEAVKFNTPCPTIFVSGDARVSTPDIIPYLIHGLADGGAQVTYGGVTPTPHNYWAVYHKGFDAGIMVSASHNPAKYNGFKPHDKYGKVWGEECVSLYDKAMTVIVPEDLDIDAWQSRCSVVDYKQEYIDYIVSKCDTPKKYKLLVDAGNAVPGAWYPDVLRAAGHEVVELFCDLDGTFPNHQPDPLEPENCQHAMKAVVEHNCDFGLLFDGDGDRLGVVRGDGTLIPSRSVMAGVLFKDAIERNPGCTVAADVMSSLFLQELCEAWGGVSVLGQTGHAQLMECRKKHDAEIAVEFSGHIMSKTLKGYDDAVYAALAFLRATGENPDIITEVQNEIPSMTEITKYYAIDDAVKYELFKQIQQGLLDQFSDALTLDGVRVNFGDSEWCILRTSNSTPCYKLRVEAHTKERAEELLEQLEGVMRQYIALEKYH